MKNIFLNRFIAYKAILIVMAFFICLGSTAQQHRLGSWHVLNARVELNKKFGAWFEAQTRSQELFDKYFYHELKGGFTWAAAPKTTFLLGVGQYGTYNINGNFHSPMQPHELRLWEQMTLINDIGRFKIEHRYRIEQRFVKNNYRNRFRYRISGTLPLNHRDMKPGTLYLNVNNEIFLTNTQPYFERNRAYAGFGYMFTKLFTWQVGFLHQFDYSKTHVGSQKNFIQSSLLFDFHPAHPERRKHIGIED